MREELELRFGRKGKKGLNLKLDLALEVKSNRVNKVVSVQVQDFCCRVKSRVFHTNFWERKLEGWKVQV